MNAYLLTIIGTVLLCALLTAIAPEGKLSSSIKGVAKLVCILAIIVPILRFFETKSLDVFIDKNRQENFGEDVIEADGDFIEYYSEMRVHQAEILLEKELLEKYYLECEVLFVWKIEEEIRIEQINIKLLQNANEEVKSNMCDYLTKNYCSEVLIE